MVIDNQEESFYSRIEQPIEWDWRKIKELESNDWWKSYQFEMDDNTDKILTPDDVKNIIKDNYNFCIESITLVKEDNTEFNSWTCKAGDIIRVYVNLLINETTEAITQSESIDEYTFDNVYIPDDIELDNVELDTGTPDNSNIENPETQESPYKEMIENQTWKIRYWDRSKPELSLTIDDGDGIDNIRAILQILKDEGVKATFFIKGTRLGGNYTELRREAILDWHQICCHTYSHFYLNSEWDITSLITWLNKKEHPNINDWVDDVKRLLWEAYYNDVLKADEASNVPDTIRSDLLLETEILMWEAEIRNILWKEEWTRYLQEYKKNYPFIRLPWWHWVLVKKENDSVRENTVEVLRRLWYLSIVWSDDFKPNWVHQSIDNMKVENWWIPLFHFKWKTEQQYIKDYIAKAKSSGKSFKPLSDIIRPE